MKPRQQLSEDAIQKALDTCAKEPIHIPGSIQPYGVLFALDPKSHIITQVSENIARSLNEPDMQPDKVLGRKITDILGQDAADIIDHILVERELEPIRSSMIEVNGQAFDVVAHRSDDQIILEMEIIDDQKALQRDFFYDELRSYAVGIRSQHTLQDLYDFVTAQIRHITGFDRVKLYKFDEDWNGEVVAEAKADFMPSYKGLHFPASDIPEQARKLYMKSYIRQIADISYAPVPLVPQANPATGKPLDMSLCALRSVSPIHVQYLDNMNVKSSMSITVIQNGEFWGLIACHHNSPNHVPYRIRMVSEIMGHVFSAQLSTLEELADRSQQEKRRLIVERLSSALESNFNLEDLLNARQSLALEALGAQGMAIHFRKKVYLFGDTPNEATMNRLVEWMHENDPSAIYTTHDAKKYCKDIKGAEHLTGGFLAAPVSHVRKDYVIWFREAVTKDVKWAGNPEKPLDETIGGYRLTPRSSFDLWKETVSSKSKPWTNDDLETAQNIIKVLIESEKLAAEHANRAKSEFLTNISHELRTPMNAILGIINILDKRATLDEDQKELIGTLKLSSNSLLNLINDLLDISRIESKEMELEKKPFNLGDILAEIRSVMNVRAIEKNIQLNVKTPDSGDLNFIGDVSRMRQILMNLVSNAIKFTEEGFVNVLVKTKNLSDTVERVCIDIVDSGIGMTPTQCERIFDKFVQADSSISRRYGGTGLGLAIVKNLVDIMGGEIEVQSKEGMGSKFSLEFEFDRVVPVSATETVTVLPTIPKIKKVGNAAQPKLAKDRKRVLLVEDYEGNVIVALTLLQDMGYEVVVANNGQEAIEKLEFQPFDLVLMDLQMPVMDGFEATKLIRQKQKQGEMQEVTIVAMTAHALKGDKEKCIKAGMDDYISKPFDLNHLQRLMTKHAAND